MELWIKNPIEYYDIMNQNVLNLTTMLNKSLSDTWCQ